MSSVAKITIHESQFPESVRRDLLESLRTGEVNHKFHYDSVKQTQKWLALHQAYSPSRTNPDCSAIYERSFEGAAKQIKARRVHLIGLGCGGGQKDTRLLKLLKGREQEAYYTPSDVSAAMVLVARKAAMKVVPEENCYPLVCDLATAEDVPRVVEKMAAPDAARIVTFFGMIPNFEPEVILPRLSGLLRREDWLLFGANLAPGNDYEAGVRKILPQYDNEVTRDWLMTFLTDLGFGAEDGKMEFRVEDVPKIADTKLSRGKSSPLRGAVGTPRPTLGREKSGHGFPAAPHFILKRVAAYFQFRRNRELVLEGERFRLGPAKPIRLFYSYRHTPELVKSLLKNYGIAVVDQWIVKTEEEGVFLCRRK